MRRWFVFSITMLFLVLPFKDVYAEKVYRNTIHGYEIRLSNEWVKDKGSKDKDITYINEVKGLIFDSRVVDTALSQKELNDFCFFIAMGYREKYGRIIVSHSVEYLPKSKIRVCYILAKTSDGKYVSAEAFIPGTPQSFALRVLTTSKRQEQAFDALKEIARTFKLISSEEKATARLRTPPKEVDRNVKRPTTEQRYFKSKEHMYALRIPVGWQEADNSLVKGSDLVLINKKRKVVGGTQYVEEQSPTTFQEYFGLLVSVFEKERDLTVKSRKTEFIDQLKRYCGFITLEWKTQNHVRTIAIVPYVRAGKSNKYLMVTAAAGNRDMVKETIEASRELVSGLRLFTEGELVHEKMVSAENPEIYNIRFGTNVMDGRLMGEAGVFPPSIRRIHIWFNFRNISDGSGISTVWYYLGGKSPYRIVKSNPVTVSSQTDYGEFSFELAEGKMWPKGRYRVDILLDDRVIGHGFFEIGKFTPFSLVKRINELMRQGATAKDFLAYFNGETRDVIKKNPWLLEGFLSDLGNRIEIEDLIPNGPDYILKVKGGHTIYLERIGTDEDFRIDLVSH